ncbi:MAG: DoxX family protein [Acidobacteria bacterium]|nr:DoxX family protein [Acidobacteriota bacterium]
MLDSLKNCQPQTYAALRIVAGFLFLWHGAQKLLGFPLPTPEGAPTFILYIAGPIELIGGALIMVGLFTRPVAFLASGLMAFAYFLGHATRLGDDQPIWHAVMPLTNGGETAVLFCFVFLYIAAKGNGMCSIGGDED